MNIIDKKSGSTYNKCTKILNTLNVLSTLTFLKGGPYDYY